MKLIKAIRGAITVEEDSKAQIREASVQLISSISQNNALKDLDIISIYFTLTPDLKSLNPATAVRENLNWTNVSMICAQEAFIEGGLPKCIRALLHVYLEENQQVKHLYLKEAQSLRNDWCLNL